LAIYSCATFKPLPIEQVPFRGRAQTQNKNNVRVTAAVLSAKESQALFDLPLYDQGIQPIWLEIENNDEENIWFAPVGLDPDYFAPLEVAYMNRRTFSGKANKKMEAYFHDQGITKFVPKGGIRSGFVFTNLDMGTKAFNVDIVGEDNQIRMFTFFISVPGLRVSHQDVDFENLYSKEEMVSYEDEASLRKALENLPCCSTNKDGTKQADPLNVVFVSSGEALHHALIRSRSGVCIGAQEILYIWKAKSIRARTPILSIWSSSGRGFPKTQGNGKGTKSHPALVIAHALQGSARVGGTDQSGHTSTVAKE
jgi:hypothetical protein